MSTPLIDPSSDDRATDRPAAPPPYQDSSAVRTPVLPTTDTEVLDHSDTRRVESQDVPVGPDRATMVARQKELFGGMKIGSAFFGWLTATGMAVILIALLAAAGVAFGIATSTSVDQAVQDSASNTGAAQTVGLVGAIALLIILFLAYYCGGYVAGRMARFNGITQGLAVWLWGIVITLAVAAIAAIAGSQYDVFATLNLPRLPINEGQITTVGAIAIGAAVVAALIGALLGGLAGMRFHRKVDAAGLEPLDEH